MHPTKREVQPTPTADTSSMPTFPIRGAPAPADPAPQPPLVGPSTGNPPAGIQEIQPVVSPANPDSASAALPLKRKSKDLEVPSATEFAEDFCNLHNLVTESPTTRTPAEEDCIKLATEAREEYKRFRDDELDRKVRTTSVEDRAAVMLPSNGSATLDRSLTNDQKYKRRLFNNKKSSHASKVYEIVLRRAQLTRLRDLQKPREDNTRLRVQVDRAEAELAMWRTRAIENEHQVELMRRAAADTEARLRRAQTIFSAMPRIVDDLRFSPSFVNPSSFAQVGETAFLASQAQASQNESNYGLAGSSSGGNEMLKFSSSMPLSEVDNAEGNRFTSGLTCTPSQDTEDRQLGRHDPGRLIGINLLGSQTNNLLGSQSNLLGSQANNLLGSQSQDLPSLRTNLGADDAVEGIFSTSQGQSSGQN